jgi:type II secretory pathway component PulF
LFSLPVVGELLMRNQLTLFNQLFYLLLSSATPILEAIDLVAESMTFLIFKEALYSIKKRVAQGLPLAASFTQEPIFPTIESQLINVGEQTGTLEKMFERLMSYYQERTNEYVKKVISLLEPIVIVILAVGVAIMVWAVFGPIYGLVQLPTT